VKKFEFVDITTADVAFVAYGKTLDELFSNAALAMFEVMTDTSKVEAKVKKQVKVKGEDLESLLCNWLNEVLFYYGSENLVFSKFDVKIDKKNIELSGICYGEKIDLKKHEVRTEVKAATMHKMKVWKEGNIWKARVILDI